MGNQMGHSRISRIAAPVSGAEYISVSVSVSSFKALCCGTAPFAFPEVCDPADGAKLARVPNALTVGRLDRHRAETKMRGGI